MQSYGLFEHTSCLWHYHRRPSSSSHNIQHHSLKSQHMACVHTWLLAHGFLQDCLDSSSSTFRPTSQNFNTKCSQNTCLCHTSTSSSNLRQSATSTTQYSSFPPTSNSFTTTITNVKTTTYFISIFHTPTKSSKHTTKSIHYISQISINSSSTLPSTSIALACQRQTQTHQNHTQTTR